MTFRAMGLIFARWLLAIAITSKRVYPVGLGQRGQKTIPCPAAHPLIGHIREYPSPGVTGGLQGLSVNIKSSGEH